MVEGNKMAFFCKKKISKSKRKKLVVMALATEMYMLIIKY